MARYPLLRRVLGGLMVVTFLALPFTTAFTVPFMEAWRGPNDKSEPQRVTPYSPKPARGIKPVEPEKTQAVVKKPVLPNLPSLEKPSGKPADRRSVRPARLAGTNDFRLLVRLIHAEAGGESLQGQVAVGAVILNRIHSGHFPKTIRGNIFKRGEFESVSNGYIWSSPTFSAYKAARLALQGWDPSRGALYFYNPAKTDSAWIWSRPIIARIGNHFFAA